MAFSSAVTKVDTIGSRRLIEGTFTNGSASDVGGDVDTQLRTVDFFWLQVSSAAVIANAPVVNETLPADGSAISIITNGAEDGKWMAIGR